MTTTLPRTVQLHRTGDLVFIDRVVRVGVRYGVPWAWVLDGRGVPRRVRITPESYSAATGQPAPVSVKNRNLI